MRHNSGVEAPLPAREQRVAAYAICIRDRVLLMARFVDPDGPIWTLPGGGIEHGEDPADAVLREFTEETGYVGRLVRLLGIHSARRLYARGSGNTVDHHALRIMYEVTIEGGVLRNEVGGSTDRAEWFPLDHLDQLHHAGLVDVGLAMHSAAAGHP